MRYTDFADKIEPVVKATGKQYNKEYGKDYRLEADPISHGVFIKLNDKPSRCFITAYELGKEKFDEVLPRLHKIMSEG